MKNIRTVLSEVNSIHMAQAERVRAAADQAHLRSQTRSSRAYNKVNTAIQHQLNNRSPV
ncbi:hypothetical protein [Corynebacterium rhinophilum]|uniref:hypothetical protein n=1 Tax=Corynebacterium rhinophilum TaxID=3050197 RepID=UPI0025500ADD|nr:MULTISPECIES: hypothetical protein [unclassified Corynebacterium]MDK8466917.1 hypothetical protein [Corynebacterium sp. MSK130]MDK8673294.1 hypothetical protein [Corynebacterium sp. MSK189]MDK8687595.1 hypothetical protein [Corynebacterium sp. MSK122]